MRCTRKSPGVGYANVVFGDHTTACLDDRRDESGVMDGVSSEKPSGSFPGDETRDAGNPWQLTTAPGTSAYTMHLGELAGRKILVCTVGKTVLHYDVRCVDDLQEMLMARGDWVDLGGADEQRTPAEGSVEAWARDPSNPIGGWYGLRNGYRGRFAVYVPPLLEVLGRCELEHGPRNNRARYRAGA